MLYQAVVKYKIDFVSEGGDYKVYHSICGMIHFLCFEMKFVKHTVSKKKQFYLHAGYKLLEITENSVYFVLAQKLLII